MHRTVVFLLIACSALFASPVESLAQRVAGPDSGVRRLLVTPFASADRALGVLVADAVREQLAKRSRREPVRVIPKDSIADRSIAAGYPGDTGFRAHFASDMARALRAHELVFGDVARLRDGSLRVQAWVRYMDGHEYLQPLVGLTVRRARDAASRIAGEQIAARAQLDGLRACDLSSRGRGSPEEGVAAARRAIGAYPRSAPARVCLGWVLQRAGATSEAMRAADEVLAMDSLHVGALQLRYALQNVSGDRAGARLTRRTMRRAQRGRGDPPDMFVDVDETKEFLDSALARDPRDASLLKLRWQILGSEKQFAQFLEAGDELARLDAASADSTWYWRMTFAADQIGQRRLALDYATRAVQRFPGNASFLALQGQMLTKAMPPGDSTARSGRAGGSDPFLTRAYAERVAAFWEASMPDSVRAWALRAHAAGVDRAPLSARLVESIVPAFQSAQRSRLRADWQSALAGARTVDSLVPSRHSAFFVQAAALEIGKDALGRLDQSRSCAEVRLAEEMFRHVRSRVPTGDGTREDERMLGAALEAEPRLASYRRRFCHSASRRPR